MPVDLGNLPGWLGAVATSGAFLVTSRLLYIESARRRYEKKEEREAAAAKVVHWLARKDDGSVGLVVSNTASTPVFFVELHLYVNESFVGVQQFSTVPPSGSPASSKRADQWLTESIAAGGVDADIRLDMLFTDSASVNWARNLNGLLVPLERRQSEDEVQALRSRYAIDPFSEDVFGEPESLLQRLIRFSNRNSTDD